MLDYIRVGDLGKNRNDFLSKINKQVGKGNWFWAFQSGSKLYSWQWGLQLYEDAFYQHIKSDTGLLRKLVGSYDIYEKDRQETESLLDYKIQKLQYDHYSDIAYRRCLVRFGLWFSGTDYLPMQGTKYEAWKIPFHLPHLIRKPDERASAKSWMDTNKVIAVATTEEDQGRLAEILVK
jgi:hypothetical protein